MLYHGAPDVRGLFSEGFKRYSCGSVFFAAADYRATAPRARGEAEPTLHGSFLIDFQPLFQKITVRLSNAVLLAPVSGASAGLPLRSSASAFFFQ